MRSLTDLPEFFETNGSGSSGILASLTRLRADPFPVQWGRFWVGKKYGGRRRFGWMRLDPNTTDVQKKRQTDRISGEWEGRGLEVGGE